jgi:hypothetical protein
MNGIGIIHLFQKVKPNRGDQVPPSGGGGGMWRKRF